VSAQNDYYTVFTVLQQSVPWQARLILPGIILFGIIGAVVAIIQRWGRLSKSFIVLTVVVCAVFLLLTFYAFRATGVENMYARARETYLEGQYSRIEGTVTNFHPMPLTENVSF
jgi:type III secretory pathway component EscS